MAHMLDEYDPPSLARGGAILQPDAVFEILLRLPAKTLCRLRVVCRSWRSLTTDPLFIKAHEAHNRQEPPLLLVATAGGGDIYVTDLAGNAVKRVRRTLVAGPREHLGPICLVTTPTGSGVAVLDPAAGAVSASLPDCFDYTPARRGGYGDAYYALGRAAATGEHKVLRVLRPAMDSLQPQKCDVFTLDDRRREWMPRSARSPPVPVLPSHTIHDVVIGGIAYFLSDHVAGGNAHEPDCVWSFDLETEEWAPAPLRGPLTSHGLIRSTINGYYPDEHGMDCYIDILSELSLAQVDGCLVTVRDHDHPMERRCFLVDLWFLTDMEKGLWVKQYSILKHLPPEVEDEDYPRPLLVMSDGRVVFTVEESRLASGRRLPEGSFTDHAVAVVVWVYDPRNGACVDVATMEHGRHVVGVYMGGSCLLRLRTND